MKINTLGTFKKIILLIICIILCAIGARFLNSGETLYDYARNNPEAAYGSSYTDSVDNTK